MPYKDPEKRKIFKRENMREWRKEHPERAKELSKENNERRKKSGYFKDYAKSHEDELKKYREDHWTENKDEISEKRKSEEYLAKMRMYNKLSNDKLTLEVLYHYSNGTPKCSCCGEKIIKFLTIDHIHNNGAEERRKLGYKGNGIAFYRWLKKHGYPEGYQVLCRNCNWGKHVNDGVCPHKNNLIMKNKIEMLIEER